MATGRCVALTALLAHLAAIVLLLPPAPARADNSCSLQDLWNGLEGTASAIDSGACAGACADGIGCGAAAAMATALGGVAADSNQSTVNNFCSQVDNAANGAGDLASLATWLANNGIDASKVLGGLIGLTDALNVAQCGCSLEQGIGQLGGAVLSCLQGAICGLQQDLGWGGCSCTPPPPVAANCTPPIEECTGYGMNPNDPACAGAIYGRLGDNPPPVVTKSLSNGTLVINVADGWDGHSAQCAPDYYCFCPAPMQVVAEPNLYADGGNINNGYVMYVCECPKLGPGQNTHAAAPSGPGAEVCICDDTGLPAVAPIKSTINPEGSICPTPLTGIPCPQAGQQRINGKCVTPCADPTKGMTPDGACCDPTQVTTCGQCCPSGTTPVNGSCISTRGQTQ